MDNHIIAIHFNLQLEGYPLTYEGNPCFLETRLAIFKKYCINAWANQTDPNFTLLLYCDLTTPEPYKSELLELENKYKFIKICWDFTIKKGFEDKLYYSTLEIYKNLYPNSKNIISSRFYNDDIPEIRYNEYVKLAMKHYDIISLARGIYWDINTNQFLDSTFPTGPFICTKSPLNNYTSPFSGNHHEVINKKGGKILITEEPLWIQLIHGKNIWNQIERMPGKLYKPSLNYLKTNFALDGEFKINS